MKTLSYEVLFLRDGVADYRTAVTFEEALAQITEERAAGHKIIGVRRYAMVQAPLTPEEYGRYAEVMTGVNPEVEGQKMDAAYGQLDNLTFTKGVVEG